ncbi:HD domain-containing protein [Promicromonospora sp. MS192]|uniref:HD domain-containing protein n=1 Tax=Promicromonospora sp. MS192 TaxID=3412684 RepID=UPI003C30A596
MSTDDVTDDGVLAAEDALIERAARAEWRAIRGDGPPVRADELADELEDIEFEEFERRIRKSVVFRSGVTDPTKEDPRNSPNELIVPGDDPRLERMPERPTLQDFFEKRFSPTKVHMLQSARLARLNGHDEKIVLACLLHDIGMAGFIRGDHGYWGAQLVEPYVDEEVSWAIRAHQALRFFPDESVGYEYPDSYKRLFGEDYTPPGYLQEEYARARRHRWYMSARLITLNDLYSFDPDVEVEYEDFADIIGRHFNTPEEGLGFDNSPVAHMWRTMIWPTRSL